MERVFSGQKMRLKNGRVIYFDKSAFQSKKFPGRVLYWVRWDTCVHKFVIWIVELGVINYIEEIPLDEETWKRISWLRLEIHHKPTYRNTRRPTNLIRWADETRLEPPKYLNIVAEQRLKARLAKAEGMGRVQRYLYLRSGGLIQFA